MSTPTQAPPESRHRWLVLATVALAQLMVVLDATIVNIALPSAQAELGFSDNDRQWVVTAYALAFGSLLLLGGRLSDMFGRRRMFLIGLVGFAAASALGGAAQTFELLVGARALQGVFAAVLAPAALSVLTTTFTIPKERARAFGVFGAIAGMGGAIGLLLGGYLTENLDWRWNLYVNVVIAVVAFVAGSVLLSRTDALAPTAASTSPACCSGRSGLFALVFGFSQAEPQGWDAPVVWGSLVASVVLLVGFVLRQTPRRAPAAPAVDRADRDRGAGFLAILVAGSGMFGVFLFLTYYLQLTLGYTPMQTGTAFLPMILTSSSPRRSSRTSWSRGSGPSSLVPLGMTIAALARCSGSPPCSWTAATCACAVGLVVMGIAMGSIMPASFQIATLGVDAPAGGCRLRDGLHQPAGRWRHRHRGAQHPGRDGRHRVRRRQRTGHAEVIAEGALHSFSVAYTWSAGIFVFGAILTATLFRTRADREARLADAAPAAADEAPVLVH